MRTCHATGCDDPATRSWQRWATTEEIAEFHETGDLPSRETEAQILVVACDDHTISPDLAVRTHDATCVAPPICDCTSGAT